MTSMASYPYERLDRSKREIRLLCILPELKSLDYQGVECVMRHFPLDASPRYNALSYVWGTSPNKESITINGHAIEINQDLEVTMRGLRYIQSHSIPPMKFWWIDVLCIDQKDDGEEGEKSWQVQRMRSIYESAGAVFVWLKEGYFSNEYSARAIEIIYEEIKDLSFAGCSTLGDLNSQRRKYLDEFICRLTFEDRREDISSMPFFTSATKALGTQMGSDTEGRQRMPPEIPIETLIEFFANPWWKRVWVQQEVAASKQVFFVCGRHFVPWISVVSVWYMLRLFFYHIMIGYPGDARYTSWANVVIWPAIKFTTPIILAWERTTLDSVGASLRELLLNNITASVPESSDPRDKVFAMLGLANDPEKHGIVANYSEAAQVVFGKVTKGLLESDLEILEHCIGVDLDIDIHSRVAAPSWVPEWFVKLSPIRDSNGMPQPGFIDLSNSSLSRTLSDNEILDLGGNLYDEVKIVGNVLPTELRIIFTDDSSVLSNLETMRGWLLEIKDRFTPVTSSSSRIGSEGNFVDSHASGYKSHQDVEEALWKLPIVGGHWEDEDLLLLRNEYLVLTGGIDPPIAVEIPKWREERSRRYRHHLILYASGKSWFISSKGYLGLGRPSISPGDHIAIFDDLSTPFVIRRGENSMFRLIGPAQVHGMADSGPIGAHLKISLY